MRRCTSVSPSHASPAIAPQRSASEAVAVLPPISDLLQSLPLELRTGNCAGCE